MTESWMGGQSTDGHFGVAQGAFIHELNRFRWLTPCGTQLLRRMATGGDCTHCTIFSQRYSQVGRAGGGAGRVCDRVGPGLARSRQSDKLDSVALQHNMV